MNFNSEKYVWFDKSLPFTPEYNELIYVETEYSQYLNDFFRNLLLPGRSKYWEVSYLPKISESLTVEHLAYMFPYLHGLRMEDFHLPITCETLLSHLLPESADIIRQGLIEYDKSDNKGYRFIYHDIRPSDHRELLKNLEEYTDMYRDSPSMIPGIGFFREDDGYADRCFAERIVKLSEEISTRVHRLRMLGVSEAAIKSLLDVPIVISRMVITTDFRILLPDYNIEIKMTPLVKAVYFLFLMHPEGIQFFQLRSYRDELLEIYKYLNRRSDYDAVLKSIEDVTDPTKNSINEKCTRIKEAFYREFRSDIAEFYCINGGERYYAPKKIELDRSKVEFEDKEFLQDLQKCRTEVKHTTFVPEAPTDGFMSNNFSFFKNKY